MSSEHVKGLYQKRDLRSLCANIVPEIAAIGLSAAYSPVEDNLVVHEVTNVLYTSEQFCGPEGFKCISCSFAEKNQRTDIMDILLCSQISPANYSSHA